MPDSWDGPDEALRTRFHQPRFTLLIGSTDLSEFASNITVFEDDKIPHARVALVMHPLPRFDYLAEVTIFRPRSGNPLFTGSIISAEPTLDSELILEIASASEFREFGVAPYATSRTGAADLIQMHVRGAGFTADRIDMDPSMTPPAETFEVAVPVLDCDVDHALRIESSVRLIPIRRNLAERFADQPGAIQAMEPHYAGAEALAVTYVPDFQWMSDAESSGLAAISRAIDWLIVLLRDGGSVRNETPARFRRDEVRSHPRLAPIVIVTGLQTGRSWIRELSDPIRAGKAQLHDVVRSAPPFPYDPRSTRCHAAFARAADERLSTATRVSGLWEALEYFAAEVRRPDIFEKRQTRALRKWAVSEGFDETQMRRVDFAISQLNSSSLQDRIWHRAAADKTYLSPGDRQILTRTREYRNAMVHGNGADGLTRAELNYAVSVVSRLLLGGARGAN